MAQEDNNNTSGLNSGMLNSLFGGSQTSIFADTINLDELKGSTEEINSIVQAKEDNDKQSMQEVLTTLQSATADKAVLTDSFNSLENLSFKDLIGKPMKAAIEAQADAARSTLDFVKDLCVTSADGKQQVAVVSFEFFKNGKKARINLPLLSLVNIPAMEISKMTYKFTAKIDSHSSLVVTHNQPATTTANASTASTPSTPAGSSTPSKKNQTTPEAPKTDNAGQGEGDKKDGAADLKSNIAKQTTMAASYTAQSGLTAQKESKYAVSTTMDIDITIEPDEIPGGIQTMLKILDGAIEIINPNGELTVDSSKTVIQDGFAIVTATYRNPDGLYTPGSIKCKGNGNQPEPQIMLNSEGAKIIFTKPGLYTVTADKVSEPILVFEAASAATEKK